MTSHFIERNLRLVILYVSWAGQHRSTGSLGQDYLVCHYLSQHFVMLEALKLHTSALNSPWHQISLSYHQVILWYIKNVCLTYIIDNVTQQNWQDSWVFDLFTHATTPAHVNDQHALIAEHEQAVEIMDESCLSLRRETKMDWGACKTTYSACCFAGLCPGHHFRPKLLWL